MTDRDFKGISEHQSKCIVDWFKERRAMTSVMRAHTIDNAVLKRQNLAHHTFNMLMLADLIMGIAMTYRLARAIMHHDLLEFHTGDVPAPY